MIVGAVKYDKRVVASLEDVLSYQHKGLIERLMDKMSLSRNEAEELKSDMLRFLYLCGTDVKSRTFAPPELIDEAWHNFILFTREYGGFCKRYFGGFIHHAPNTSEKEARKGTLQKTLEQARVSFGPLSQYWGNTASENCVGGSCSASDPCVGSTNCQSK